MTEHALILRTDAAQATLDEWKARAFCLGAADCARMVASHLRRLGYQVKLPAARSYRTPRSAQVALRKLGYDSMPAVLDALGLPRIPPASALASDIIQMPWTEDEGGEALAAFTVAMGNGRVLGWHDEAPGGAVVMQPLQMISAWRVEPRNGSCSV